MIIISKFHNNLKKKNDLITIIRSHVRISDTIIKDLVDKIIAKSIGTRPDKSNKNAIPLLKSIFLYKKLQN